MTVLDGEFTEIAGLSSLRSCSRGSILFVLVHHYKDFWTRPSWKSKSTNVPSEIRKEADLRWESRLEVLFGGCSNEK